MMLKKFLSRNVTFRLTVGSAAMALCFFIGCGNNGAGCEFAPGNENDNAVTNDNGDGNVNDNSDGTGNDNTPENENDNDGTGGGNENENDNTVSGGNDNDDGTGGNDNDGTGNDNTAGNTNDNETSNTNDNGTSNSNGNANANTNTNSSNQNSNGGGPGGGTGGNPVTIRVKSSGATKPGQLVTLSLEEDIPAACNDNVVWTQLTTCPVGDGCPPAATGCPSVGSIVHVGDGSARFTAPTSQNLIPPGQSGPVTTCLSFEVNIPANCAAGTPSARRGTVTVPVQVANVLFDLPATLALNTPLNLTPITAVSGAPTEFLTLYFATDPLPPGVDLDINQFSSTLTIFAGTGQAVQITVQVFATAGLLGEASDTVQIVAEP